MSKRTFSEYAEPETSRIDTEPMPTVYTRKGFVDRADYLEQQAEAYGLPLDWVNEMADLLGETEDFDGLVSMLNEAGDLI